jgi:uroporphyrinogen III methyltransferase/synthase
MSEDTLKPGTVYLVGAGPGDPRLLTLRGLELLQQAEVVLIDYLANDALLEHVRTEAEVIILGRHGSGRSLSQEEIIRLMLERAAGGLTVVRLKGGDPSIFGRGAEEAEELRAAGIPYEIVPGITTAQAVAAYAEVPLTHRDEASALALVTGRERHDRENPVMDYAALAQFPGTLVFYMGVGTAGEWSRALIEGGKSADTPVAIVRWVSRPEQESYRCTLGTVADYVTGKGIEAPAVFVVGTAAARGPDSSWFAAGGIPPDSDQAEPA